MREIALPHLGGLLAQTLCRFEAGLPSLWVVPIPGPMPPPMSASRRHALLGFLTLAAPASWARSQTPILPSSTNRTLRRFTELELSLLEAMQRRDSQRLDQLLADDFEFTVAQQADEAQSREDWLNALRRTSVAEQLQLGPLAIKGFEHIALVSFSLKPKSARGGRGPVFVVDTWRRSGDADQWQLAARYAAPIAGLRTWVPGDSPVAPRKAA